MEVVKVVLQFAQTGMLLLLTLFAANQRDIQRSMVEELRKKSRWF